MQSQSEVKASFKLLVFASLLTLALWFIPFAGVVTYPIRLFVTYLHEIGHALAALATFGGVNRVALDWSGSGVTFTQGGLGLLISSAGYLTTTVYGSALLLFLRRERNAKVAAIGTGALLLLITGLFGGNIVAWLAGLVFGAGCLFLGMKGRPKLVHFCMSFLAVQCQATGGFLPPVVWAAGWAVVSIGVVAGTLLIYYRSLRERASLPDTNSPSRISDHSARAAHPNI